MRLKLFPKQSTYKRISAYNKGPYYNYSVQNSNAHLVNYTKELNHSL